MNCLSILASKKEQKIAGLGILVIPQGAVFERHLQSNEEEFWETVEKPPGKKVYLPKPRRVSPETTYSRICK
jgi:hypothetical protein